MKYIIFFIIFNNTLGPSFEIPGGGIRLRDSSGSILDWSSGPRFDSRLPRNLTVAEGSTAVLSCRVFNLRNKTVSWIRQDSLHILSAGRYTYTSDQRYLATHNKEMETWTITIKNMRKSDMGIFECQVSSQPVMSYFINLKVVVPTAEILGDADIYVQSGSSLNLTCIINHLPNDSDIIQWSHSNQIISYDSARGGVSILTSKGEVSESSLILQNLGKEDAGTYQCQPGTLKPAFINVHVLNGEISSSLAVGSGTSLLVPIVSLCVVSVFILILGTIRTVLANRQTHNHHNQISLTNQT